MYRCTISRTMGPHGKQPPRGQPARSSGGDWACSNVLGKVPRHHARDESHIFPHNFSTNSERKTTISGKHLESSPGCRSSPANGALAVKPVTPENKLCHPRRLVCVSESMHPRTFVRGRLIVAGRSVAPLSGAGRLLRYSGCRLTGRNFGLTGSL